jgi:hypothetical protein
MSSAASGAFSNGNGSSSSKPMSSPLVTLPLTVHALNTGIVSVFALLASDTLCFASKAEQAVEHENRCLQVYSRRVLDPASNPNVVASLNQSVYNRRTDVSGVNSLTSEPGSGHATTSATTASNKAILAWGSSADRRWKELIQVTESEDQVEEEPPKALITPVASTSNADHHVTRAGSIASAVAASGFSTAEKKKLQDQQLHQQQLQQQHDSSSSSQSKRIRRRRPLLLFFPQHNDSNKLGVYRSLTLLQK